LQRGILEGRAICPGVDPGNVSFVKAGKRIEEIKRTFGTDDLAQYLGRISLIYAEFDNVSGNRLAQYLACIEVKQVEPRNVRTVLRHACNPRPIKARVIREALDIKIEIRAGNDQKRRIWSIEQRAQNNENCVKAHTPQALPQISPTLASRLSI